jgi:hypothetical protein
MTIRKGVPGAMLLDTASIRAMDIDDLEAMKAVARSHGPDSLDAQRTLQRGLDNGTFVLGSGMKIRHASEMRDGKWIGDAVGPQDSESEKEKTMNVRSLLSHEPRLGDNPSLALQPSIETIVREHFDRMAGEGQGAILADMYLEKVREFAIDSQSAPVAANSAPTSEPARETGPIDPGIAKAHVANMVRKAVIEKRNPQTGRQIVEMIVAAVRDGSIFKEKPELGRHFVHGGLIGEPADMAAFVALLASEGILTEWGNGYIAQSTEKTAPRTEPSPQTAKPAPSAKTAPEAEAAAPKPEPEPRPEAKPKAQPSFSIATLLTEIGVDLKVGNLDIISGVEKASRTGNPAPLMAGLAGVLLSAVAKADDKKSD